MTLHTSSLKKNDTIKHTLTRTYIRFLVRNAPLVFCHGMDNEVRSIPITKRTTMSFAELRTVALANQFLEDPVPASSLVALLLEAVGSMSSTAVSFSTSLGSLPSSIRTRNDASMILPGSHRQPLPELSHLP